MKKLHQSALAFLIIITLITTIACDNDTPPLPDNLIEFESGELGFGSAENDIAIRIPFSRAIESNITATVNLFSETLNYGAEFNTTPEASGNTLLLTAKAGAEELTFTLSKVTGILFDGNEIITFTLTEVSSGLIPGQILDLTVKFSEIISTGATVTVNGGGAAFPNRVFIDLSANRQTAIKREEWDFGFYQKDGEYKVILNNSLAMMAKATSKTNINDVVPADSAGLGSTLNINAFLTTNMAHIDSPDGNLDALAIGSVSATESENKVFIVNRGNDSNNVQRSWKKVRVLRNGTGYTIQHADIEANEFQTIDVPRDPDYLFAYVNLDNNTTVAVEPEKERWDIAFSTFMNQTNTGEGVVPYVFNDIILQNRHGVETAMVMTSSVTYESFQEADLSGIIFSTSQINIGSGWRVGGGPGTSPSIRTDRFYLIVDNAGNVYKARFTSLTTDGERGRPVFEFSLVKKGE